MRFRRLVDALPLASYEAVMGTGIVSVALLLTEVARPRLYYNVQR